MDLFVWVLIIAIILGLFGAKNRRGRNFKYNPSEPWPFVERRLQTKLEEQLYTRLKELLPDCHIFAQVQVSRLIDVRKGHDFNKWFNRINRMSVDFVVCDENLKTLAVIELDDSSHRNPQRQMQDQKKNSALMSAGIKILRWQKIPPNEEIISNIKDDKNTLLAT